MMLRLSGFLRLGAILLTLSLSFTIAAQSTDSKAVVLTAFQNLATLDGYTFSQTVSSRTHLSAPDLDQTTPPSFIMVFGDVNQAQDYSVTVLTGGGEDLIDMILNPMANIKLIHVADQTYTNMLQIGDIYSQGIQLESGWRRREDALNAIGGTSLGLAMELVTKITLPTELPLRDEWVVSVIEIPTKTIDERSMRVFEVKLDAKALAIEQFWQQYQQGKAEGEITPDTQHDLGLLSDEDQKLLDASEFELDYRIYIDAQDQQIHQIIGTGRTYLPYKTLGYNNLSYDIETHTYTLLKLSEHGKQVTITAPDLGGD